MRTLLVNAIFLSALALASACGEARKSVVSSVATRPVEVKGIPERVAYTIDAKCALTISGDVYCWGGTFFLNVHRETPYVTKAVKLDFPPARAIASFSIGEIAWVLSQDGKLFRSRQSPSEAPVTDGVTAIFDKSTTHPCVMKGDGVFCGYSSEARLLFAQVTAPSEIIQVLENPFEPNGTGAVILNNGDAYCKLFSLCYLKFLESENDVTGTATTKLDLPPVAALTYGCALGKNGLVYCWGTNRFGERGIGTGDYFDGHFVPVKNLRGVIKLAGSAMHRCAIDDKADLWCWGYNGEGQIGIGRVTKATESGPGIWCPPDDVDDSEFKHCAGVYTPEKVLSDVKDVSVSNVSTCAVKNDGSVSCWGRQTLGNLGNGVDVK